MLYIYSKEVKELIPVTNHEEEVKVRIIFADGTKHLFGCCSMEDLKRHFSKMIVPLEVVEEYFRKVGDE